MIDADSSARLSEAERIQDSRPGPNPGVEIGVLDILTRLALQWRTIVRAAGLTSAAGLVLSLALPVRYTATTRLMPPQQSQSAASLLMNQVSGTPAGSLAALAGGSLGLKNPNDLYVGLLDSRPVADAIIQRFGLQALYRAKDMTEARKNLAEYTAISAEKAGFISVSFTDRDRKRAAAIANAYTSELRALTKTLAVTEASERRFFYEDQMNQAREALVVAEASFQRVQQNRGMVQPDVQARAMIESLSLLRAQIAAKEVEVEALRSYSTENNPEVELVKQELSSLRGEAVRLEQRKNSTGIAGLGLGDVPDAGMEYLRAEHELKYRQALFDLLIRQYDAAKLDEAKDASIIQVVEPAIEPDRKSSPKRVQIVLMFTCAGLAGGFLWAQLRSWAASLEPGSAVVRQLRGLQNALAARK